MSWWIITWLLLCGGAKSIKSNHQSCSSNIDYKDALSKGILFFQGQRSGKLPANQQVKWRADSALSDGHVENVNLSGGYYDAGDNVKFGWPMAYSMSLLSWGVNEYGKEIDSSELKNLLTAIRWGTNFLLRAHTSSTTFYTQVGDGNKDHACWERPEDMDTPRTLYKITPTSPGTEAAAEAAAALAAASIAFRQPDPNYSHRLLRSSKSLFEFADKYRGSYQGSCPFYCSFSGYQQLRLSTPAASPLPLPFSISAFSSPAARNEPAPSSTAAASPLLSRCDVGTDAVSPLPLQVQSAPLLGLCKFNRRLFKFNRSRRRKLLFQGFRVSAPPRNPSAACWPHRLLTMSRSGNSESEVLMVANTSSHWVTCTINFLERYILIYDSLQRRVFFTPLCVLLPLVLHYSDFYSARTDLVADMSPWSIKFPEEGNLYMQNDNNNCGVYALKYAEAILTGKFEDSFEKKELKAFRKTMARNLFEFSTDESTIDTITTWRL